MNIGYIPKLSLEGVQNPFSAQMTGAVQKMQFEPEPPGLNFKSELANLVNSINHTATAPDAMMRDAMTTGNVDIHDLMIANAKAELVLSVTAQTATKVVQAYDKILQIQL